MFYVVSATLFSHLCFQVDIYQEDNTMNDYVSLCNCLQALNDSASVSTLLNDLLAKEDEHRCLLAYQVAFDLCEKGGQKTWRAPFLETAETLRSAVRDNVCVAYTQFYLRYKDSGFTKKHPEKYIKRSPEEVSLVVEELFGGRS